MKKLLLTFLFVCGCSNLFIYQDLSVYNLNFTMKDPYTLSKNSEKTTIKHKDIVVTIIELPKDPQSSSVFANAILTRLAEKEVVTSPLEIRTNKNSVKYSYFQSISNEVITQFAIIKEPEKVGYIVACNKKEYDEDNLCSVIIDSLKMK